MATLEMTTLEMATLEITMVEIASMDMGMVMAMMDMGMDADFSGEEQGPIAYYKLMVDFEITGSFTNYLKFRNVIANKSKIVNIEKEKIDTSEDTPGQINAKATVSLVKAAE